MITYEESDKFVEFINLLSAILQDEKDFLEALIKSNEEIVENAETILNKHKT